MAYRNYSTAVSHIVDPSGFGDFTTIQAAITAASSGQTIFVRPGTYTENLTLKAGVDIVSFDADALTPNVTIVGNCTATFTGTASISGIRLRTNSAALLTVSGSNATIINLNNCYLDCTNNTGITFSSSSASALIYLYYCKGDLGTTGIALFSHSSAGTLRIQYCNFTNTGASSTNSTASAGRLVIEWSKFFSAITTSGTNGIGTYHNHFSPAAAGLNITAMTVGGSGTNDSYFDIFSSGTASALSVGGTTIVAGSAFSSTNTNAITGAGTIIYSDLTFSNSSSTINTTTQTRNVTDGGEYKGRTSNTAPSAGMLGEQIRSFVGAGSPVTVNNNTATNITSISLTAGIWDVSCNLTFVNVPTGGTAFEASISTTSATRGTQGDNNVSTATAPTAASVSSLTIPQYRITLSSTTTVYMVAYALFSGGALGGCGRISAVRVA